MTQRETMFALLKYVMGEGEEAPVVRPGDLPGLFALSNHHDLAHLIGSALDKSGQMPGSATLTDEEKAAVAGLKKQKNLAVFRAENIGFEYSRMCDVLEQKGVDFVPLKGAILRPMYPAGWMRTSCDIDVLVREEETEKAAAYLCEVLNGTTEGRDSHDLSVYTESGVHLELHFCLDEYLPQADGLLSRVWEDVSPTEGWSHRFDMSDGMFYLYHIAHMAKHVLHGGCGVRPFLDLWLLDRQARFSPAVTDKMLRESGLLTFAEAARALSRVWLGGEEHSGITRRMEEYLLSAGVYGAQENRMAVESQRMGRRTYILRRIFMPYDQLKVLYPTLRKHKWLYPFYQVKRWVTKLFKGRIADQSRKLVAMASMPEAEKEKTVRLMDELGI